MTDLGFGLADKRSILVVLVVFFLAYAFFGYAIPIDSTSAVGLLSSLVVLTAFLFLCRNSARLILALIAAILSIPFYLIGGFLSRWRFDEFYLANPPRSDEEPARPNPRAKWTLQDTKEAVGSAVHDIVLSVLIPLFIRDWEWDARGFPSPRLFVLGLLDRLCLIGIAFLPTLPAVRPYVQTAGIFGMILMLITYVISGRYTLLLWDASHKTEVEHDELVKAAGHPHIDFPPTPSRHSWSDDR